MQQDIVDRLREEPLPSLNRICRDRRDAADEIERLRAKLDDYEPTPDSVSFWYMHDGQWFSPLVGTTLDEIIADAERIRRAKYGSYGALCEAILTKGRYEVRRVKVGYSGLRACHAGKPGNAKDDKRWQDALARWKTAHEADTEVMALVAAGKIYRHPDKSA
jgi:hypothetical protein